MEPRLLLESHPIITEFLAVNSTPIYPAYPESDWDWIEIYNPTAGPIALDGWHLTDNRTDLTAWTFPSGVTILPDAYVVVFASDLGADPYGYGDLHADFKLSGSDPEYLGLVMPRGWVEDIVSEYYPTYPKQIADVSYGLGDTTSVGAEFVGEGSPVRVLVPTGEPDPAWAGGAPFDDSGWDEGETSVGYETEPGGGLATAVKVNFQPSGSDIPPGYLLDSGYVYGDRGNGYTYGWQAANYNTRERYTDPDQRYDTLNYMRPAGDAVWEIQLPNASYDIVVLFGDPTNTDQVNTMDVEGTVLVDPDGGDHFDLYVLTVTVTDGRLTVRPAPGAVNSKICYIDITPTTDPSYENYIYTDVLADMADQASTAYMRFAFNVDNPLEVDSLVLRMRYDDGFAAYLNGVPIAQANAPVSPAYNATATAGHGDAQALVFEEFDVSAHRSALVAGQNILAIHGLNEALLGDPDFLIQPELLADVTPARPEFYYTIPTRGADNIGGSFGLVADTTFDCDRGFYTDPFAVTITTQTAGATIYYTTDGSKPLAIPAHQYTGPIPIATTTTLRAMAHKPGYVSTNIDTQTYLFASDVAGQATDPGTGAQVTPAGWPTSWGSITGDYQMDPNVGGETDMDGLPFTVADALLAIPTLSVVMAQGDFLGTSSGIYRSGKGIEKGCSLELINPDGTEGFQIDCSVEIQGGTSTSRWKMEKLSMQVKFKEPWGPTKLDYDLFDDPGATNSFDTLILDARMNQSWAYGGGSGWEYQQRHAQYIRDQFAPDIQNAMGGFAPYGKKVHLYVNGIYWGLYGVHERPDEKFAAAYMGGDREDYYVIKDTTVYAIINGGAAADSAFQSMFTLADSGMSNNANFLAMWDHLDVYDFIDYMIMNFYIGNTDWAHHNWYVTKNAADPDGRWRFHAWDSEHCLKGEYDNVTGKDDGNKTPTRLQQRLETSAEYRLLFADHVHKYFFNDGLLTPGSATELYMRRATEIDRAIVGESARWGDNQEDRSYVTYTRQDYWLPELDRILGSYITTRTDTMVKVTGSSVTGQFRNAGLYPNVVAPTFHINGAYQHGGAVSAGGVLTIPAPAGTIYYTLDGTDPRITGPGGNPAQWGNVSPTAMVYNPASPPVLTANTIVKARVRSGSTWSALDEATYVVPDTLPPIRITEIMYNPGLPDSTPGNPEAPFPYNESFEYIELQNTSATHTASTAGLQLSNGVAFTFPS
ncbi:MAG: hypothetical protein AMK72_05495, partial [Planctomycetes bacterium SM23_25]